MDGPFFGISAYHILLVGCGFAIVVAYWLPRYFSGREPAASGLLIIGGLLVFGLLPGVPEAFSPIDRPKFWEIASEFAVIIALFGTGIRIDRVTGKGLWGPTARLLAIAMPLSMLGVVLIGSVAGLTIAGAVLLAAVLAPTDPVLAADVQVGPPLEGGEHPVRLALTTEAGLNDGLAFPFVYLAIFIVAAQGGVADWLGEWFALYVVYKIAVGVLAGIAAGGFGQAGAAQPAARDQKRQSFQNVGLARAVGPGQHDRPLGQVKPQGGIAAEVAERQPAYRERARGGDGGRPGRRNGCRHGPCRQ